MKQRIAGLVYDALDRGCDALHRIFGDNYSGCLFHDPLYFGPWVGDGDKTRVTIPNPLYRLSVWAVDNVSEEDA